MAQPKKGQMAQFMIPLVDSTDFASVESAVTESDFNSGATVKFYGVNHGVSDAYTSGTVSKTGRLVRSGVFQITLKGTENNYDMMLLRVNKTGAAEQIREWENLTNDDSDLMSFLTAMSGMLSDAHSAAILGASAASDAHSAATLAASRALLIQSRLSDLDSRLISDLSDVLSAATAGASRALINQSRISDVQSFLSDFQSDLLSHLDTTGVQLNASVMSDLRSAIAAGPAATVTASDISDIASAVWAFTQRKLTSNIGLNASDMSDLRSAIAAGPAATVTASDISDIASAVRAILISDLSDIHSAAKAGASRALVVQSLVSDLTSLVVSTHDRDFSVLSNLQSTFESRIPKEPAARSQLSDIGSDLRSYLAGISGAISDVESQIDAGFSLDASTMSDLRSAIAATELDASDLSDIASAVRVNLASDLSDILSAAQQTNSRTLVNQSRVSDVQSYLVALSGAVSDIESQIDAGVNVSASGVSDIVSRIGARTLTEPAAQPDFTASFDTWMAYWAAISVNKITQTSVVRSLRNAADTSDITSFAVSDDGTTFIDAAAG